MILEPRLLEINKDTDSDFLQEVPSCMLCSRYYMHGSNYCMEYILEVVLGTMGRGGYWGQWGGVGTGDYGEVVLVLGTTGRGGYWGQWGGVGTGDYGEVHQFCMQHV